MAMTLSELFVELSHYATSYKEPILAHISRMAALEAQGKEIPAPPLGLSILGMWDWDAVGDSMYLDETLAELFNVNAETARTGLPISEYIKSIHPGDAPRVSDAIMKTLKKGGPYESRYRVLSGDKVRHILARGACTLDKSGKAVRFPGVILEVPTIVN